MLDTNHHIINDSRLRVVKKKGANKLGRYSIIPFFVPSGCLAYHSALEFLGFQHQVFNHIQITSPSRFRPFCFQNETYVWVGELPRIDIIQRKIDNTVVLCTSLSQTLVDCIYNINKIAGTEELLEVFFQLHHTDLDFSVIEKTLHYYNCKSLWQRCGYLFDRFSIETDPPKEFLKRCQIYSNGVRSKLGERGPYYYDKEWGIRVNDEISNMVLNGVSYDYPHI